MTDEKKGEALILIFFDKALLSTVESIGGLFLLVKKYFASVKSK